MEFPHLQKLVEKYGSQGFVLITINTVAVDEKTGAAMMARYGFVPLQATPGLASTYKVNGMPVTFVLDADGKQMFRHDGFNANCEEEMGAQIEALLARVNKKSN